MPRGQVVATRILVHHDAPPKPALGTPCNGCGVCCLAEPCPLGSVLSGRRTGACAALRWVDAESRYRCGALVAPREVLPRPFAWLAPLLRRLARRWIAAGTGCDSTVEVSVPGSAQRRPAIPPT
ncbi:MAG: hypothetical protein ACKVQQ_14935 [Burkholderiales bacterium]